MLKDEPYEEYFERMVCLKQEHISEKVIEQKKQLRKREMVGKLASYFTSTFASAALNVVA